MFVSDPTATDLAFKNCGFYERFSSDGRHKFLRADTDIGHVFQKKSSQKSDFEFRVSGENSIERAHLNLQFSNRIFSWDESSPCTNFFRFLKKAFFQKQTLNLSFVRKAKSQTLSNKSAESNRCKICWEVWSSREHSVRKINLSEITNKSLGRIILNDPLPFLRNLLCI